MENITNSNFFDTLSRKMTSCFLSKDTISAAGFNSQSDNSNASQRFDHYFKNVCILLLFVFSGFSTAVAQTTPANCTSGCTSKDIKIINAFLSDQYGAPLPDTFICNGTANVYLSLTLTTKSPRIGTAVYGNVYQYFPETETIGGQPVATVAQCFGGITLNATNVVTFTDPFSWTCGDAIALTDVYISWGTGNTDFCTGSAFQCGATPSKCNRQEGNIIISTPNIGTASASACSLVALPNYSAYFNLTSLEADIKNGGNLTVTWFSDLALTTPISDADTNTAGLQFHATAASTNVYAKVCVTGSTTSCETVTVPLTIYPKPAVPTICVVQPSASLCDNTTTAGSITITSPIGAAGVYDYSIDNGLTWTADKTSWTGLLAGSVNGVKVRFTSVNNDGCPSDASSCADSDCTAPTAAKTTKPDSNKMAAITPTGANTDKAGFEAYPVPFKDQLSIKYNFDYESDVKIEVFNAQGIRVFSKTDTNGYLNKETALDLKMNKGKEQMYVVKITTNRGTTTRKVMSSR
ncbi:T9SS type A sorting domain-containing protein [Flavobacterium caseinilyticum]|nr:T9SS type A sorting domain-containing protein [Flavobacterium caseinilyticum]